jgi:hypothetical protein
MKTIKIMITIFFLFTMICMLSLSAFNVKFKADNESVLKNLNDTLVITTISIDLYICSCKPDIANPGGAGGKYIFRVDIKKNIDY